MPGVATILRRTLVPSDPALRTTALGLELASPIGLAAGFDKDARLFAGALALGFGFVEVGTVTARPQRGNDRPRVARLPRERALLNRFGFNNAGAADAGRRLSRRDGSAGMVGANLGKTKVVALDEAPDDYRAAARAVAAASDFLVVNVSSPNTSGLRSLQEPEALRRVLRAVLAEAGSCPVLLKVAPDLGDDQLDAAADVVMELGLSGIVATNTSVDADVLDRPSAIPPGLAGSGISGAPIKHRSLAVLRRLHRRTGGRVLLVAVGGIETAADAWERVRAGATLLEVYTGFVYDGPGLPARLARDLAQLARDEGYARVQDAVGTGT
jgi:dihydroorotate dehydrogenase